MKTNTRLHEMDAREGAVFWVVLLHTCENLQEHLPKFAQWVRAHPDNYPAYLAFKRIWRNLAEFNDYGLLDRARAQSGFEPLPLNLVDLGSIWQVTQSHATKADVAPMEFKESRNARNGGWWVRLLLLGACLLMLCGAALKAYRSVDRLEVFEPPALDADTVIILDANSQVTLDKPDDRLSWTSGLLSVDGDSLGVAAQRINRYNRDKIEVDPSLAHLPVWGLFPAHDPRVFADALDRMLSIRHFATKDPVSGATTIHVAPLDTN
jgi:hypothetical protein